MSLELAARHIAAKGRNGDSMLVHMTPGEVAGLSALARAHGGEITVNPDTGLPEANFLKKLLPAIAGAAVSGITGFNPMTSAMLVGGATGLASGSLSKGLAAGLGAYGGAGLMGGLATLGGQALAAQEAASVPYASNLPPGEVFSAPSLTDRLTAGAQRLTQEGGPTAFMNAMGGAKPLMQAGLAGLAGMSAFAPDRAVPTVTRQPGQLRPMVFQRRQTPLDEAQRTGRYFEDSLTPLPVVNAAEGGLMPDDGEPVQFMADGGQAQALDMNRLRGMQQADAINYLRGFAPQQVAINEVPNQSEGGGSTFMGPGGMYQPVYGTTPAEGVAPLTGFQRQLTPIFDPSYAGGQYGDYTAQYNPQGALQNIQFMPRQRHAGWFGENQEWLVPLVVGAGIGGATGMFSNLGTSAGALGGGEAVAAGGAGGGAAAATNAQLNAAILAAEAGAAGTAGLGALGSTLAGAASNPFVQGAVIAGLTGAAAEGERPITTTAGTDLNIPSATNPIILAGSAAPTGAGGTPGMRTQSEIAFDYLMGRRPTSRATSGDLSTEGLIDLYNQRGGMSEADFVRMMQQRGVTNNQLLLARNTALDRRNATLPQPTVSSLVDAYRQQAAAGGSEEDIVTNARNQGVSLASMNATRNAMLGLPAGTEWADANRLVQERGYVTPPPATTTPPPAASSFTPQSIADAYQQAVGSGAMSEAEFVQRAMQEYGVSANQLGEARNLLLSSQGMADGGLAALARGGGVGHLGDYSDGGRLLRGPGDGVSDDIPATINGKRPARLADGEFVVPARIVSELGNGSTEAGARQLYAMMDRIQKRRSKTVGKQNVAVDSKAHKLLPA